MVKKEGEPKTLLEFHFELEHPRNNCPNSGSTSNLPIFATDESKARLRYESEPVVCGHCTVRYRIKNIKRKS